MIRHSHDPYLYTYPHHNLYFTYTPLAGGLFALLSVMNVQVVNVLLEIASVASLVGVLWLTWGALGYQRSSRRLSATLCVAAVALWLEPVRQTLSFGQVNLVLMVIIVADLCLPDSRWWKGVGIGLAAGFKLTPLIFIPYLLLTRRYRAAAVAAGTFGLTIAGSLLLLPKASRHYWLDGLVLNSNRIGNVRYVGNQSLNGALLRAVPTSGHGGGRGRRTAARGVGVAARPGNAWHPDLLADRPARLAGVMDAPLGLGGASACSAGGPGGRSAVATSGRRLAVGRLVRRGCRGGLVLRPAVDCAGFRSRSSCA